MSCRNAAQWAMKHKTHQKFFHLNLKKSDPILINFGTNSFDTTGHQMTVWFPASPTVCFCTTWGKTNKILHF